MKHDENMVQDLMAKINMKMLLGLFVMALMTSACQKQTVNLYTIGDSTMANKKAKVYPETGWAQVLDQFFDSQVIVHNHAVNGRSSKSFINQGRWQVVLDSLQKGDYVFIQFGHNDQKSHDTTRYTTPFGTYTENLTKFINETREKDAIPVLFTSIVRRKFVNDTLVDTHTDYPVAVRQLAVELNVPVIDLQKMTEDLVKSLGDEPSKALYLWVDSTDIYPKPRKDNTHLCVEGAKKVASLALNELASQKIDLAEHIVK